MLTNSDRETYQYIIIIINIGKSNTPGLKDIISN